MQLPLAMWVAAAVIALLVCGLGALTIYAILRDSARGRLAQWPALWVLALIVIAAMPWLVVRLAPISIEVNIHGKLQLAGWILVALIAFTLLVLLPLTAVLIAVVWWSEWRRRRRSLSHP